MQTIAGIQLNMEVWLEGDMYIAYIPQLDLSSCGKTVSEAKNNLKEAAELFFEETDRLGTTKQILEESGFKFVNGWQAPKIITRERINVAL